MSITAEFVESEYTICVQYVGTPWCGTCRTFKPEYNRWKFSKSETPNVTFEEVNLDEIPEGHAYHMLIRKLPSIVIEKKDNKTGVISLEIFTVGTWDAAKTHFNNITSSSEKSALKLDADF